MKDNKKKNKKKFTIIELVIIGIVITACIVFIAIEMAAPGSSVGSWVKENILDTEKAGQDFMNHLPVLIQSIIYVVIIYAVCKLIRIIFEFIMKKSNRARTVVILLDGLVKYACAIAIIIFVLQAVGVNSTAIFASVGILTLVIGLGCQSLIADVVAGMFIIFENEYNVGEIITIGDFRGTVTEIGIRDTTIMDAAGNISSINNSEISSVINLSRELSLAVVDCEFPYDVPIEVVEGLLKDNFDNFKKRIPAIIEGPFYKGVSGYGASNVAVKVVAKCHEEDRYQVQRDLLREYRKVFTEAGIDLSFNQVVVQNYQPTEYHLTKKMKQEAEQFIDEQKELSKDVDGGADNKQ
ncbi:MAG: mechanosensitive ion channel family protein [Acholeplasmatales bacterium]|nr:mechanosensitive ion channel family protein [Acholeplasmatales bacterium]